ncbi:related to Exocyst complex component Sec3 [Sporisorium reilianum SRZ2]|uniref:Related to Exocyst complex component Sec3 n=1 Tax=Sporisorium reilianum (strain SRZ2) TaxID=999809 RepID=E6ZTF3_SPORE|nr:related to Exocyst complex component Sec3 [Sporisorium reilianum SRZ2]
MSAVPSTSQLNANGGGAAANKTKDLFNAALQARNPNNAYIAHLKIWEEVAQEGAAAAAAAAADTTAAGAAKKARYLILAVQRDTGRVTINKAKRNANGTFSIGKDWDLNTLREVHVIQPDVFSITLSRPYQWQTQQPVEQHLFLQSLVKVYCKYTQDDGPRLVGIDVPLSSGSAAPAVAESANLSDRPSSGYRTDTSHAASSNGTAAAAPAIVAAPAIKTSASPSAALTRSLSDDGSLTNGRNDTASQSSSVNHSPTKSKREGGLQPSPLSRPAQLPSRPSADSQRSATSDNSASQQRQTSGSATLAVPRQPAPRKNSGDSLTSIKSSSSGGLAGGGGDARARLSSIEPIRGGAAYERMLLAGTGLTGVTEVDDDETAADEEQDPYGGAVLAVTDAAAPDASFSSKRATLGRPAIARLETDKTKLSNRSKPGDELDDDEDENSTLVAVEEMLEGFEWRNASAKGYGIASGKGTADMIEARLLDELSALESANIHAIIESDDRVALVVKHMEGALNDLDMMDSMIAGFKVQLNSRADDISHIESQNRGLQVQTSNQRTLMTEIENLINTINVDEDAIHTLSAGRLENPEGVAQLEYAAASLYKSMLQARRDGDDGGADMAAAAERLADHEAISSRFCKRVLDYLNVTFNVETQRLLSNPARQKALQPPHPSLPDHASMEEVLGQYCGLLLYMKEVSSATFSRVSAAYFASASECYRSEMQQLFAAYRKQLRNASDEDINESSFVAPTSTGAATAAIRSGTIRRAQRDKGARNGKDRGDISGQDGLQRILSCIFPVLLREQSFISDLLHINDNNITFADYMDLEPYFRRRAAGMFTSSTGPLREMKGAMDLIFGFVAPELQAFTDDVLSKDRMSIVGLLATLDRGIIEAEEVNCESLQKVLAKLHLRLASQLERFVQDQIKGIEATKLTVKKRKGVVHFMRVFPVFVERVETQLVNAETLNIRHAVDGYYAQICGAMFDALQTISRVETAAASADEDKGQLNHLVILIENMFYFISEINKASSRNRAGGTAASAALAGLVKRAEAIYGDSLGSYTQFVLRRSLARMMDFGDGIDALLKSTPAAEVGLHSAYSNTAYKKMVKDMSAKDARKAVEALAKRVAKHFDDDDVAPGGAGQAAAGSAGDGQMGAGEVEVLSRVWSSCEQGYVREFERVARIGSECYPDVGASLELGPNELRRLFASLAPKRR